MPGYSLLSLFSELLRRIGLQGNSPIPDNQHIIGLIRLSVLRQSEFQHNPVPRFVTPVISFGLEFSGSGDGIGRTFRGCNGAVFPVEGQRRVNSPVTREDRDVIFTETWYLPVVFSFKTVLFSTYFSL